MNGKYNFTPLSHSCDSLINVGGKLNNTYIPLPRSVFCKRVGKYLTKEETFRVFLEQNCDYF